MRRGWGLEDDAAVCRVDSTHGNHNYHLKCDLLIASADHIFSANFLFKSDLT